MMLIAFLALFGAAIATERYIDHKLPGAPIKKGYEEQKHGYEYNYIEQFNYQGKYNGECGKDGMYYMDDYSFVFCTHQFAYVQPCPSGTMNSGFEKFKLGSNYNYREFCDINLVDAGYGAEQHYHNYHVKAPKYEAPKKEEAPRKQYLYHGKYEDTCDNDGFYYKDEENFVMCSNGYAFVQPCAPGTRNSGYINFAQGQSYYYRDFCDVNLVDEGYGVQHGYLSQHHQRKPAPGHKNKQPRINEYGFENKSR